MREAGEEMRERHAESVLSGGGGGVTEGQVTLDPPPSLCVMMLA